MALKIDPNQSATAYHITDGATLFPYAVDAQSAIGRHPLEWRDRPWTSEEASAARQQIHDRDVAEAKAKGLPAPAAPPAPLPLSPEDQKALDEHNKAVADAAKRLDEYYKKKAEEEKIATQVAADEALVASVPPQPDPTVRRPLTPAQIRKASATLTPEEQAAKDAADRAEAAKADTAGRSADEAARAAAEKKIRDDKAEADRMGIASRNTF